MQLTGLVWPLRNERSGLDVNEPKEDKGFGGEQIQDC